MFQNNQQWERKIPYYKKQDISLFQKLDLFELQKICIKRMKLLKCICKDIDPLNTQGRINFNSQNQLSDILSDQRQNALSFWICRFAFSLPNKDIDWFRKRELLLYAYQHQDDNVTYKYEDFIKTQLNNEFEYKDIIKYEQKFGCYVNDQKYVQGLLRSFENQNKCHAIKNNVILITQQQTKNQQENLPKKFQYIDFLYDFDELQEYSQDVAKKINDEILKDLFQNILEQQFQETVIDQSELIQKHQSEIQSQSLFSLIQQGAVPGCMARVLFQLKNKHHLKHSERLQLYPWLQDCGIKYEDALQFIKKYFCQDPSMSSDKFQKEYQYNIEHIYGRKGKKQKSHCVGCQTIIGNIPGPGLSNGCPYRCLGRQDMEDLLTKCGINDIETKESIFKSINNKKYTNACETVYFYHFKDGLGMYMSPVYYTNEAVHILKSNQIKLE